MTNINITYPTFERKGILTLFSTLLALILLISICATYFVYRKPVRAVGGFDFRQIEGEQWAGPNLGQKIDFTKLKDSDGVTLANRNINTPIMMGLINTNCGMCTIAKDHLAYIKEQSEKSNIPYILINVSAKKPTKAHLYMQGLASSVKSYVWLLDETTISGLYLMVSPSHLLVSPDGQILAKWPGSSDIQERRDKMGNQTVADMVSHLNKLR